MKNIVIALFLVCLSSASMADNIPFSHPANLFDASNSNTLGLSVAPGSETVTVFAPGDETDHFSNGVVMIAFKGALYCMWQSSQTDEDAADTWVAYSRSLDEGKTWSTPMVLAEDIENGYCSSGGWHATADTLVAYINTWPDNLTPKGGYTRYVTSTDGINWSAPADVTMADGSRIEGIFEQDPHVLPNGRIVNATHKQPGLKVMPIYTDDPLGVSGWKEGAFSFTDKGEQSRELEPSLYWKSDGTLVMIFRDQNSTYLKMAATSTDNGETWSNAVLTDFPDARTKQSAGNLPDGTAYFAGNPVNNKTRIPLVLTLSRDGNVFDTAYLLRSNDEMPPLRYEGSAKRAGYHYPKSMVYNDYLYVAYATNKEDVQYTRVPLSSISLNESGGIATETTEDAGVFLSGHELCIRLASASPVEIEVYAVSGHCVARFEACGEVSRHDISALAKGVYVVRVKTVQKVTSHAVLIK